MSDTNNYGFGRFVPGFDFLQNIAKGASKGGSQVPSINNWVAPTLNVEELDKRISELKAVHFWLDQNGKALGATIQALEVQKMTLATLKGMNFSMGELANALKLKPAEPSKPAKDAAVGKTEPKAKGDGQAGAAAVDPLQWWGSLTHQFQQIASNAMKDVAQKTAMDAAKNMATDVAGKAGKAGKVAQAGTTKAAKKPARKKAPTRKA